MSLFDLSALSGPVVAAQLLVLVGSWVAGAWFLSPLRTFPGPTWASFTRLWHIYWIVNGNQNVVLRDLHDKHGPFVRIAPDEISVNHPEGIKKILLAPLHKGYWYKAMAIPDYRFQTPMSQTDPKKKNEMSRQFSSGYTLSNVLQNEGAFDNMIELFLSRLDEYAKTGKAFDLDKYITFMAWDVIGEVIFSKPFGFLKENYDIGDAIENSKVLSVYASVVGFVRWFHVAFLGNPFMTWLGLLPMGHLYTHTVKALDERLDNRDSRFDCIAHWFRSIEKSAGKFKERDVYAVATGAVGAGSDTVSCAIQSFVYYLNRHQGLWERLQAEIDEAIKEKNICQDTVVTFADVQQLPFLQACIKEVLRIHAPVPMGLPRVAPEGGLTIGDTHIPQGTIISINSWVFHHNKEVWGDDAREFNPDRWMTAYAANLEKFFMPWGQGYNSCPGQHIARIEIFKVAATLVRDYAFRQVNPKQDWQWKACFTMVPHSWPCYVEKRELVA